MIGLDATFSTQNNNRFDVSQLDAGNSKHVLDTALEYLRTGINVIPLKLDGSKSPAIRSWKLFQTRMVTERELFRMFDEPVGIGIVCGAVSDNLEGLDFDDHDSYWKWRRRIVESGLEKVLCHCPVVETPSDGFHVLYRCDIPICGNSKIATRDGAVLIETRGEGGYVVAVGSPDEVHSLNRPYVQMAGPVLPTVPVLTKAERAAFWKVAVSLDELGSIESVVESRIKRASRPTPVQRQSSGLTPWKDFDSRADWADILRPAGWSSKDKIHWTRAGKNSGLSAVVRKSQTGDDVLVVFTSTGELAAQNGHSSFSKSKAFTVLHHASNYSAAAKSMHRLGFGGGQ